MRHPSPASAIAAALPMPLPAPVTTATLLSALIVVSTRDSEGVPERSVVGGKGARQPLASFAADVEVPAVDDGEAEAARRHRVRLRQAVFVEGDLYAGDVPHPLHVIDDRIRRMA